MSDTSVLPKVDHQQRNKQTTLSQEDLELLAASNALSEQEAIFIQNLNVDQEEKQKQKKVYDRIEEQSIPQEKKVIDLEDLRMYVLKAVSRQTISPNLAAMEPDFFDKVELLADEINENDERIIKEFIAERLERIIMYSKSLSTNVCKMLTAEEQQLYIGLCDCVGMYRKSMSERLKIVL